MSFTIWSEKPPFPEEHLTPGERIYQIGNKWVVTDKPNPTQADIDTVLNAPAPAKIPDAGAVLRALAKKGVITVAEAEAEIK